MSTILKNKEIEVRYSVVTIVSKIQKNFVIINVVPYIFKSGSKDSATLLNMLSFEEETFKAWNSLYADTEETLEVIKRSMDCSNAIDKDDYFIVTFADGLKVIAKNYTELYNLIEIIEI